MTPAERKALDQQGYYLYRTGLQLDIDQMKAIAHVLGNDFNTKWLEGSDDPTSMTVHSEGLNLPRLVPYFLLGCVAPAQSGGKTLLYDARLLGSLVYAHDMRLKDVRITYWTRRYPDITNTHPLIEFQDEQPLLRFRIPGTTSPLCQRMTHVPTGLSEESINSTVSRIITDNLMHAHEWRQGDCLVVNNTVTLHARTSFVGYRKLLRFRIDDPINDQMPPIKDV